MGIFRRKGLETMIRFQGGRALERKYTVLATPFQDLIGKGKFPFTVYGEELH